MLYLFGTPGQERFGFMWEELTKGALGAVVLGSTPDSVPQDTVGTTVREGDTLVVETAKTGKVVAAFPVDDDSEIMIISVSGVAEACSSSRRGTRAPAP